MIGGRLDSIKSDFHITGLPTASTAVSAVSAVTAVTVTAETALTADLLGIQKCEKNMITI